MDLQQWSTKQSDHVTSGNKHGGPWKMWTFVFRECSNSFAFGVTLWKVLVTPWKKGNKFPVLTLTPRKFQRIIITDLWLTELVFVQQYISDGVRGWRWSRCYFCCSLLLFQQRSLSVWTANVQSHPLSNSGKSLDKITSHPLSIHQSPFQ